MRKTLFFMALVFIVVAGKAQTGSCYINTSAAEFQFYIDSCSNEVILDVRTEAEFDAVIIPNARYIPNKTKLLSFMENLDTDTPVLVYCTEGVRSAQVCEMLCQKNFNLVINLEAGMSKQNKRFFKKD